MSDLERYREALEEIAAGRHSFQRPAGTIARAALDGQALPPVFPCLRCGGRGQLWRGQEPSTCGFCNGTGKDPRR